MGKTTDRVVMSVRAASVKRAFQIKQASARAPEKFEPVPRNPIFKEDDGTVLRLADTPMVRGDMAIIGAFIENGHEYASSVFFRMTCLLQVLVRNEQLARERGLVRGEGDVCEVAEVLLDAAADAPCDWKRGFKVRKLFAEATRLAERKAA